MEPQDRMHLPRHEPRASLVAAIALASLVLLLAQLWLSARSVAAAPRQQNGRPIVSFANTVFTVDENNGPAEITVEITPLPDVNEDVAVEFFTVAGTARSGSDYLNTSGTFSFTNTSDDTQIFNVTIIDDSVINEPDETVNVVLRMLTPDTGRLGTDTATLIIEDDDLATSTPQSQSATATPGVFVDRLEPNDRFDNASEVSADAGDVCELTLWPREDVDTFRFFAKKSSRYLVETVDLDAGLDTVLRVYDPSGARIGENDDVEAGVRESAFEFTADRDGFFFARVDNKDPSDPTSKLYCFRVSTLQPLTPTPTATRVQGADECEYNGSIETACLIGPGETLQLNFIPAVGEGVDNDFFRLPVKSGISYTCETHDLSPLADTNIIFLDNNGNDFSPPLGNDDREFGDASSVLSYYATYTGALFVVVGPVNPPAYEDSGRYSYSLTCSSAVETPTPVATNTRPFVAPPVSGPGGAATATPQIAVTTLPTPTPIDLDSLIPATPTLPTVNFAPLPTSTPVAPAQVAATVNVTVYYDTNFNFLPELNEGIVDVTVSLSDNVSNRLLALGYTNQAGTVRFENVATTGAARIDIPFLGYRQIVSAGDSQVLVRVAPMPLPIGIP